MSTQMRGERRHCHRAWASAHMCAARHVCKDTTRSSSQQTHLLWLLGFRRQQLAGGRGTSQQLAARCGLLLLLVVLVTHLGPFWALTLLGLLGLCSAA
jgi:hypothetical protein